MTKRAARVGMKEAASGKKKKNDVGRKPRSSTRKRENRPPEKGEHPGPLPGRKEKKSYIPGKREDCMRYGGSRKKGRPPNGEEKKKNRLAILKRKKKKAFETRFHGEATSSTGFVDQENKVPSTSLVGQGGKKRDPVTQGEKEKKSANHRHEKGMGTDCTQMLRRKKRG